MSATIHLYGISNCDTVKKARQWLADRSGTVQFHDLRQPGVAAAVLSGSGAELDWTALLNRSSRTWRELAPGDREAVTDRPSAHALLLDHPTLIKRPLVVWPDGRATVGFQAEAFAAHWAASQRA